MTVVCFDLGGVLLRICRSWSEGCAAAGLEVRGDVDAHCAQPVFAALNRAYQCGEITGQTFYDTFSAQLDALYTPGEIERVHLAWIRGMYDGVEALVDDLRRLAASPPRFSATRITNTGSRCRRGPSSSASRTGSRRRSIGVIKPDAEAFAHVTRALDVPPESVIYFDDLAPNVAAAQRAGWSAHAIDPHGETAGQMRRVLVELG